MVGTWADHLIPALQNLLQSIFIQTLKALPRSMLFKMKILVYNGCFNRAMHTRTIDIRVYIILNLMKLII